MGRLHNLQESSNVSDLNFRESVKYLNLSLCFFLDFSGGESLGREKVGLGAWECCLVLIKLMLLLMLMISPEFKQSFLLSSKTVFMFSIQMASTGPSKSSHFLVGVGVVAKFLNLTARTPSNH